MDSERGALTGSICRVLERAAKGKNPNFRTWCSRRARARRVILTIANNPPGMRACWARESEGAWTPRTEPWRLSLWATGSHLSKQYPALVAPDDAAVQLARGNGSCLLNQSSQCWRSAERYRWRPAQASRMRADSLHHAQFCEITAQRAIRSVLLVGDSITWGMGQSLLGLLGVAAGATDSSAGFQRYARASVPCGRNRSVTVEVTQVRKLRPRAPAAARAAVAVRRSPHLPLKSCPPR